MNFVSNWQKITEALEVAAEFQVNMCFSAVSKERDNTRTTAGGHTDNGYRHTIYGTEITGSFGNLKIIILAKQIKLRTTPLETPLSYAHAVVKAINITREPIT